MLHLDIMRTTITINDELLAEAKRVAAERNCRLSTIVNEALRNALKKYGKNDGGKRFEMPVYEGKGGTVEKPLLPDEMARMAEEGELKPYQGGK